MGKIVNDALEAHEKLTARLHIQPINDSGYHDIGNVISYNNTESREYRTRMSAEDGWRYVDDEQVDTVHQQYEFVIDERNEFVERLIALAESISDANQDAAVDDTVSFLNVIPGRSYFIDARPVSNVSVEVSAAEKTEGTDYTINLNTGELVILESGTINANDTVDVTFTNPDRGFRQWTAREQPLFRGAARIQEFNQLSKEPLRVLTGNANIVITGFPEQSGEFGTLTLRLTFTEKPTITKRYDSAALTPDSGS